jgi:hypothetical protein
MPYLPVHRLSPRRAPAAPVPAPGTVTVALLLGALFVYALLVGASEGTPIRRGVQPRRHLAFAVMRTVGWNTDASEGELVVTKGLKGFVASYSVFFGPARERLDERVQAGTTDAVEPDQVDLAEEDEGIGVAEGSVTGAEEGRTGVAGAGGAQDVGGALGRD